jgi:ATP-binding cassette, subfamily B, bacterial PglK
MENKSVIKYSISSVRFYLNFKQKIELVFLFILTIISAFLEVIGLASLIPVMMIAAEPGGVLKNKYLGPIYSYLGFGSEKYFLALLMLLVLLFFVIKNVFSIWVNYKQVKFSADLGLDVVKRQLDKYLNLSFWYFNDIGSANLINSSLTVPNSYVNGIVRPLFVLFSEVVVVVVIVVSILIFNPMLVVLLTLVMVPTAVLTYSILKKKAQATGDTMNALRPVSYKIINELFSGFVELKLANKQDTFRKKMIDNQQEIQKLDAFSYLYTLLPTRMIEMVAIMGVLTIFLYAIFFSNNTIGLVGLVGMFAAAAYRLMPSINRMLTSMVQLRQHAYAIDDLRKYTDTLYHSRASDTQNTLLFNNKVDFNNITYSFPGENKPALQNISFSIKKGEKVGFIGSSGSGKTTLMNLLLRFYREQTGGIYVDGVQLTADNIVAWYDMVGYVKQDTFLMEASIKDNITLYEVDVDYARLHYAIEQASLNDFVQSLPEGIDAFIGERGSKLSGGQRQRIGIARALYKRTQVLILDEATSALDNETEREVNEAISRISGTDMTIFIIAHRITTLSECNRIFELSNGEIVAQHQYSDLMTRLLEKK